ncbi:STAS domain-containing protein [Nonomuraea ceibae]|uniref:STAS domain-containing protein n=1 Tax=Nonomuraea ceibae TaxID=1935170 RepID=UPI001C5F7D6A|nr:STAS domain-containing protein [Nonomuraea ceibae]
MLPFTLSCQHLPGGAVISVVGDVDATTSAHLDAYIAQLRRAPGDHLVFNLQKMPFLDSSGLNVLLNARKLAHQHGGEIHLANIQPAPARMLQITGVGQFLPLYDTLGHAITAMLAFARPRPPAAPETRGDVSV